ncbi:benzoate/H(+) symporter BenE family transporter [Jatrophihabitans telluris]|uniref:Benzoate/H(+) symporter BenE family transporter n=1 Tax=Jatrophihabitans telluris TaxID=2038343 RepID=A0ABY4R2G0_9ACTN|nr:benzoate/H(+) symporter BenE family transporter [Jatrophihabitans telluris]UQX90019.1 benzoate/H(+) symporter BenE family transporter [Jatrophihabitans telluris]
MERLQPVLAGLVTALVGFTSSFTVVLAGLRAVGADQAQSASGLLAVSVIMGVVALQASVRSRMPISIAWSTPGAALLVSSGAVPGGFGTAVAAFGICGLLTVATGVVARLRQLVLAIPRPLANALLAGVLVQLCVVPVATVKHRPGLALAIIATWLVLSRYARRWAVPAAMAVALTEIVLSSSSADLSGISLAPRLVLTAPTLNLTACTLGLSLFVVTMASQNVPGIAVLEGFGYRPPVRTVLLDTGLATVAGAALGAHVVNMAAISAALCAGPEAGVDRGRRWIASVVAGLTYIVFGLSAGLLAALVAVAPAGLVETVAGLALMATLGAALSAAVADLAPGGAAAAHRKERGPKARARTTSGYREAAVITFLITVSGVSFGGIGSAFWGLAAGLAVLAFLDPQLLRATGQGEEVLETDGPQEAAGQRPSTRLTAAATAEGRP